jgi:squalene synthase HpnC
VHPVQPDSAGAAGADWTRRSGGDSDAYLREHERTENFPVALRILPRDLRTHLSAVYDVARVIDDLGDEAPDDRTALLLAFRADLSTIWAGHWPDAPVLRRLAPTVAACGLSERPFQALIEANLLDQTVAVYPLYRDLEAYCELSANPVGRIVLEIFGASTPERIVQSDRICTALQIIEHCQDVAEDFRAGRCYLPQEDLDRFAVDRDMLASETTAAPELRRVIKFEVDRAAELLDSGLPLVRGLHGWGRLAVSGYMAGGRAAIISLRQADYDVLSPLPSIRRLNVIRQLMAVRMGRRAAA